MVNKYQAEVLIDRGTMEDNLIPRKFISINKIAIENLKVLISLKWY
jgi:hypothetical protein